MFCLIGLCLRCFILCSFRKNPPETSMAPGNNLIYGSTTVLFLIKCLVIELLSCKILSLWQQLQWPASCIFSDIDSCRREQTHGISPAKEKREKLKYQMCLEAEREGSEVWGHASFWCMSGWPALQSRVSGCQTSFQVEIKTHCFVGLYLSLEALSYSYKVWPPQTIKTDCFFPLRGVFFPT